MDPRVNYLLSFMLAVDMGHLISDSTILITLSRMKVLMRAILVIIKKKTKRLVKGIDVTNVGIDTIEDTTMGTLEDMVIDITEELTGDIGILETDVNTTQ